MITPSEINQKSKEFGLHISYIQRDYILGWIIFRIYTVTDFKDTLVLKGGNAL